MASLLAAARSHRVLVPALVILLASAGCGGASAAVRKTAGKSKRAPVPTTSPYIVTAGLPPPPAPPPPSEQVSEDVQANVPEVAVWPRPEQSHAPTRYLANPIASGAPLILLVVKDSGPWLKVLLPVRPNGATGWIRRSDVTTYSDPYRMVVQVGARVLTVFEGPNVILHEPVAVGTTDTPSPGGTFFTTELLKQPDPKGAYGPFAYGLSGYSPVLHYFNGGEGVIGIHGTNNPSSIGKSISHGCIRLNNAAITWLAGILPLGVPVEIDA